MEIKILTLMRLISPFLLCSTATDNLPIYTQAAEAALLLFQTSPPWKTSAFPTWVYSKTLLRNHLATRSADQAQHLGNTCARSICVFLGARPAGLFLTRRNPALLVKYEELWLRWFGDTRYLSEPDCLALLIQQHSRARPAHGMGLRDCKPWQESSLLYEPACYPVRARHSVTNKNRHAAYWWILKISGRPWQGRIVSRWPWTQCLSSALPSPAPSNSHWQRNSPPPQKEVHFFRGTGCGALACPEAERGGGRAGRPHTATRITADFPSKQGHAHTHRALPEGGSPLAPALQRCGSPPSPVPRRLARYDRVGQGGEAWVTDTVRGAAVGAGRGPPASGREHRAPQSPLRGLPRGQGWRGAERPILQPCPGGSPGPQPCRPGTEPPRPASGAAGCV